ncbi:helix-turn-helix domain-containing protein [Candidatus Kurthia intestinigallinarum]|uniref:helix-turn-helix domain-containing protein n=1 Tax=Candidatus Kurthia intestinigallinarum TaxID=1562256 RepID=UPI0013153F69|nr:helix-turn-helix domain-containing protein [Kurthia sp. 3B1D]
MKSILAEGYGIIPKLVMRDESLSIEAKAIYAYLAAFAGNQFEAYPSVELICHELNISKKRFLMHRKMLVERGYMEIKRQRAANGFSNNVYVLTQSICYGNDSLPHETVGQQGVTKQYVAEQDVAAISNRFTNNNLNNNSLKIKELAAFYHFFAEYPSLKERSEEGGDECEPNYSASTNLLKRTSVPVILFEKRRCLSCHIKPINSVSTQIKTNKH